MSIRIHQIQQSTSLELLARQLVDGFITGLHKSPYHGFSVEFAEHRLYNEGQSTRHIDWKVFARTDRLFTKQYEEETNLRCLLAIDCSSSMCYPQKTKGKLTFSIYAAAALAYLLNKQRDAVGVTLFSNNIEEFTPIKSSSTHLQKIFGLLNQKLIQPSIPNKKTQVAATLHEIAEQINKRSLVIIFSDMFDHHQNLDEVFKALQHLKHNKHEVLLFHVTDHATELEFNFEDRPYEFVDLETGDKIRLNPSEIKKQFQEKLATLHQSIRYKCNQLKIDFIAANAADDFNTVLQAYLIKRSKMR